MHRLRCFPFSLRMIMRSVHPIGTSIDLARGGEPINLSSLCCLSFSLSGTCLPFFSFARLTSSPFFSWLYFTAVRRNLPSSGPSFLSLSLSPPRTPFFGHTLQLSCQRCASIFFLPNLPSLGTSFLNCLVISILLSCNFAQHHPCSCHVGGTSRGRGEGEKSPCFPL